MGLIKMFKEWIGKMFKGEARKEFDTEILLSGRMEKAIKEWNAIAEGNPPWLDSEDDIGTINFAKFICSDLAKKTCLDIDINVDGSERAKYLQTVVDGLKKVLRDKVEDAAVTGGIMFKPNGSSDPNNCIDYVTSENFLVTAANSNGKILGAIFFDYEDIGNKHYTRMEYHRFEGENYVISNRCYMSLTKGSLGNKSSLSMVPRWENIQPDVAIEHVEDTLFAYFKLPANNMLDLSSPLGVSVFSNAMNELRGLDIAWSRKDTEVEDSKHMTIVSAVAVQYAKNSKMKLPRFFKGLEMDARSENAVHEHTATLLTEQRLTDINSRLSMISTKCGYSQGAFELDRKTGRMTATQVESDDKETIETIKDTRDALRYTLEHLVYALNVYVDLYDMAPAGTYKMEFGFGDITYNADEDRNRHWNYVQSGKYPLWRYYVKFEGMSEEEAKQIVEEAKKEHTAAGLFDEE